MNGNLTIKNTFTESDIQKLDSLSLRLSGGKMTYSQVLRRCFQIVYGMSRMEISEAMRNWRLDEAVISKKKFSWDCWNFDGDGDAYVIAKSECRNKKDVLTFILEAEMSMNRILNSPEIYEGWCSYQCRSDFEGYEGEKQGGYVAVLDEERPIKYGGGWFPVWIVRLDDIVAG